MGRRKAKQKFNIGIRGMKKMSQYILLSSATGRTGLACGERNSQGRIQVREASGHVEYGYCGVHAQFIPLAPATILALKKVSFAWVQAAKCMCMIRLQKRLRKP